MHKLSALKSIFFVTSQMPFLFFSLILLLVSCDATSPEIGAAVDGTEALTAQDDDLITERLISLFLEPQSSLPGVPVFDDRIVVAEPVYTVPVTVARAQGQVDDVNVVYVGESCQVLQTKHPDLFDCVEEETAEFQYGEVEATVSTDSDGFASIYLGNAEKYRLRVQSFVTEEDPKCYWGGEAMIDISSSEVSIPLLVFCE